VFTSPDPERTEGVVRSTKPLLINGRAVTGLRMRFEGGHAVEIEADSGAELIRELAGRDEGASRLGEVALVDGSGRIGALDTIFRHTLLDENAASHIAIGRGFPFLTGRSLERRAHQHQRRAHGLHDRWARSPRHGPHARRIRRCSAWRRRNLGLS